MTPSLRRPEPLTRAPRRFERALRLALITAASVVFFVLGLAILVLAVTE